MKVNDVEKRFNEIIEASTFICTEAELYDFQNYGYLIPFGTSYLTRQGKLVNVNLVNQKVNSLNLNLKNIISKATELSMVSGKNKIYVISENLYKNYVEMGYIISKDGKEFFRVFENELWLILKI